MTLPCFIRHSFGPWGKVQEIPIWKWFRSSGTNITLVGGQPLIRKLYSNGNGGRVEQMVADLDFRLIGKAVEQRRSCLFCNYTQIDIKKWKV